MKETLSKAAAIGILVVLGIIVLAVNTRFWTPEKFIPDVQNDIVGKTVAIPANDKSGDFIGWTFEKSDDNKVTQVDIQIDGKKRIVYVDIHSHTPDGQGLAGIMEVHYIKIADKAYIIALGSISLKMEETHKPTTKPVENPTTINAAQPFPGKK